MTAHILLPRLLRRLAAVSLIIGVLFTTLGWAHPSCGSHEASAAMSHGSEHAGHPAPAPADEPAPAGDHDCQRHHEDGAPAGAACVMLAHCGMALAEPASVDAQSSGAASAAPVIAARSAPRPLAYQPDSPPPKR